MPLRRAAFVHEENIRHFENKLKTETDPAQRQVLKRLIADERAMLAETKASLARLQNVPKTGRKS